MFNSFLLLLNFGIAEITLIFLVILLLFGASSIPKLAKSIGSSIKEFKKAKYEAEKEFEDDKKKEESEA